MGKRGPRKKPTALKELEGTYRPDRSPKNEAKPEKIMPARPPAITRDRDARKIWDEYAPRLLRLGLLTELDPSMLEGLCMAYSKAVKADRAIAKHGVVMKTEFGLKSNPAVQQSRAAWAEFRRFAAEFGMSPSARTSVEVEPGAADAGGETANGEPSATNPQSAGEDFLFSRKVVGRITPA